ncbi:MAG: hypothetical protein PHU85_13160, partial [Phycisphaerae bacterium]|nr:hypothetical protein [Phycisphaerae bacterium]
AGQNEPSPEALKQFIAEQTDQIKEKALRAIGLTKADEAKVAIGWYYDTAVAASADAPPAKAAGIVTMLTDNAKPVGLGLLAVVSLGVMLMMMRKAASGVTIAGPEPSLSMVGGGAGGVQSLADEAAAGDADEADGYSPGMEVDAETLRTQKMVEKVGGMVKQNPEAAANLVRRWITKKTK